MTYNNTSRILVAIATCALFAFLSETVLSPSADSNFLASSSSSSNWRLRKGETTTTIISNSNSSSDNEIDGVPTTTTNMMQQQQVLDIVNATSSRPPLKVSNTTTKKEVTAAEEAALKQPATKDTTVKAAKTTATTTTSTSSSSSMLPLYIGAGQGTTGTRTLYESMCSLGIPSVHFEQYCIHPITTTTNKKNVKGGGNRDSISKEATTATSANMTSLEQGVHYHQEVLVYYRLLRQCAEDYRLYGSCSTESFDVLAAQLRLYVSKVIDSGMGSVHDVPYAHMVPFIIKYANNNINDNNANITNNDNHDNDSSTNVGQASGGGRGRGSIVLLTERDPDEWVASRNKHHANSADLICHDLSIDAFDLDECIVKHHDHVENLFLYYQYILNHRDLDNNNNNNKDQEEDEFVRLSSKAMDRYQTRIVQEYKPAVVVNFWKQVYNVSSLADFVWNSTQPLLLSSSSSMTSKNVTAMIKNIKAVAVNGGLQFQRSPTIEDLIQADQERQEHKDEESA